MTPGEWALFVFIFLLIQGASLVPRLGGAVGRMIDGAKKR
jgi:Sec-independent protein translocase protein TatA